MTTDADPLLRTRACQLTRTRATSQITRALRHLLRVSLHTGATQARLHAAPAAPESSTHAAPKACPHCSTQPRSAPRPSSLRPDRTCATLYHQAVPRCTTRLCTVWLRRRGRARRGRTCTRLLLHQAAPPRRTQLYNHATPSVRRRHATPRCVRRAAPCCAPAEQAVQGGSNRPRRLARAGLQAGRRLEGLSGTAWCLTSALPK